MNITTPEISLTASQLLAVVNQGFDLMEAGNLDGAEAIFSGLLALSPAQPRIRAALGAVLHEQGRWQAAEAAYDEALRLDGSTVLALVNRGDLRCQRGDLTGIEDLKKAAAQPSSVQSRAKALLRRYTR